MKNRFSLVFLILILFSLLTSTVFAATFDSSDSIISDAVIEDDLYLAGNEIVVNDDVNGDLFVMGSNVTINGDVAGDVMATAATLNINGKVGDDIRAGGGNISINNNVEGDVLLTAANVSIAREAKIGGDALVAAGLLNFSGTIGKDLDAFLANLNFNGMISGNADIVVDRQFFVGEQALIKGNLSYYALQKTNFDDKVIRGELEFNGIGGVVGFWQEFKAQFQTQRLIFTGLSFLAILLITLVVIGISPKHALNTAAEIKDNFWKSFLVGLLGAVILLVGALVLMITVIGIPLALIIFALTLVGLYVAKIFVALWFSQLLFKKSKKAAIYRRTLGMTTLGLFTFYLVGMIPFYIGLVATLIFMFTGFGAILLSCKTYFKFLKKGKMV